MEATPETPILLATQCTTYRGRRTAFAKEALAFPKATRGGGGDRNAIASLRSAPFARKEDEDGAKNPEKTEILSTRKLGGNI
mmetsp:Transcript_17384/g.57561  ORF Transcript_17384/g.57561 Transcript_17384/m.57561 type:complete len:82 (-) Transcript_17384:2109-2354(-)